MQPQLPLKEKPRQKGKVWLMGFGPGDPELLTVKGLRILESADIIFYDSLINKEYLSAFRAEKVYVGKRKGNHASEQDEINRLLYNAASSGRNVVRLKGGDPMIFAHGGEEIEYLGSRHIEVEVIPGVTAALACSALSKIPLTHRNIASSVTILSGHSMNKLTVPSSGTLVYYMGASNVREIAVAVIDAGWSNDTPALLFYNVSGTDQELYFTTLEEAAASTTEYKTPLTIIIGNVVNLRSE